MINERNKNYTFKKFYLNANINKYKLKIFHIINIHLFFYFTFIYFFQTLHQISKMEERKIIKHHGIFDPSIGSGPFWEIYRAKNLLNDKLETLKIIKIEPQNKKYIDNERNAAMLLNQCQNIINFHHFEEDNIHAYFSMELWEPFIISEKPSEELLVIVYEFVELLCLMHKKKLSHCAIKPQNIVYAPESEKIKLINLHCSPLGEYTKQNREAQTDIYEAPEANEKLDKVDLWSFGILLLKLATNLDLPPQCIKSQEEIRNYLEESKNKINDSNLFDLIQQLLMIDPEERISFDNLPNHPYLKKYQDYLNHKNYNLDKPCKSKSSVSSRSQSIDEEAEFDYIQFRLTIKKDTLVIDNESLTIMQISNLFPPNFQIFFKNNDFNSSEPKNVKLTANVDLKIIKASNTFFEIRIDLNETGVMLKNMIREHEGGLSLNQFLLVSAKDHSKIEHKNFLMQYDLKDGDSIYMIKDKDQKSKHLKTMISQFESELSGNEEESQKQIRDKQEIRVEVESDTYIMTLQNTIKDLRAKSPKFQDMLFKHGIEICYDCDSFEKIVETENIKSSCRLSITPFEDPNQRFYKFKIEDLNKESKKYEIAYYHPISLSILKSFFSNHNDFDSLGISFNGNILDKDKALSQYTDIKKKESRLKLEKLEKKNINLNITSNIVFKISKQVELYKQCQECLEPIFGQIENLNLTYQNQIIQREENNVNNHNIDNGSIVELSATSK